MERFGPYELLTRIAVGGMAEIFRARRCGPEGFVKLVALKRVLPELARQDEFRHMFADEARLCSSLSHPGLVQVFDFGEVEGTPYLAMELVEGSDLGTLLSAGGPFEPEAAAFVVAEVARALAYVHEARDADDRPLGVVHRDLSPGNVLVSRQGDVKIGDFGVALARGRIARTEAGRLKGTLSYLSPEQASGGAVDARTDLYAAGLLLFELLTGERYVRGEGEVELLRAAARPEMRRARDLRPGLDPRLDAVLARCLDPDPERRYPHAAALERDLTTLCPESGPARESLARRVSSATAAEPPRRRTAMVCDERDRARGRGSALPAARLALVVVVLVAAVAGTALLLGNWRAGPREPSPDAPLSGDGDDAGRADAGRDDPRTTGADVRLEVDAETDAAASSDDDVEPVRRRPDRPRPLVGPPTPADPSLPGLRPGSPDGEVDPGPPELDARRLVDELEAHRRRRGLRRGDDEEADRLRAELDAALRRATPQDRLERVADAYRQRLESVAIDRAFIERKMQRATARIHAAGATPELDALSQQALRQAMAGDYAGANQSLNRILDATSR